MKPPFRPTPTLSRLEAVTSVASTKITALEADVSWYKSALAQKALWERQQAEEVTHLVSKISLLWFWLIASWLGLAACATALALRWL